MLAAATLAGLALFVIPGLIILTLWSLVGPVITIEDRSVTAALKRSWQLVRPCFWLTLCLVTLPLQIEQTVLHAIHYTELFEHPFGTRVSSERTARHGHRLRGRTRRSRTRLRTHRTNQRPLFDDKNTLTYEPRNHGGATSDDETIATAPIPDRAHQDERLVESLTARRDQSNRTTHTMLTNSRQQVAPNATSRSLAHCPRPPKLGCNRLRKKRRTNLNNRTRETTRDLPKRCKYGDERVGDTGLEPMTSAV